MRSGEMGVNVDLSISLQQQSPPPVQLDLLPKSSSNNNNNCNSSSAWLRSSSAAAAEAPLRGGIDMNQLPSCSQDYCDEDQIPSSSVSFQLGRNSSGGNAPPPLHTLAPSNPFLKRELIPMEDKCEITSQSRASDEEEGSTRKKLRLSKEQSALLEESFREHSTLNPKQKNALAKQLNLRPRQVEVWFQNRRARTKLKQTEVDCELLKRCCEGLTEENRRLHKELQELRALKVSPPCVITHDFYMPLPATTLTMCPSCERLASSSAAAAAAAASPGNPSAIPAVPSGAGNGGGPGGAATQLRLLRSSAAAPPPPQLVKYLTSPAPC